MPAPPPRTISKEEAGRGAAAWRRLGIAIDGALFVFVTLFLVIVFSGHA